MARLRWNRLFVVLWVSTIVGACASAPPEEHERGGRGHHRGSGRTGDGAGRGVNLFISPAGQPFRAGADDPYPVAAWFAAADTDHDGRLTRQELRRDAERFFHQLDANGDGVVDGAEINAYEHAVAAFTDS